MLHFQATHSTGSALYEQGTYKTTIFYFQCALVLIPQTNAAWWTWCEWFLLYTAIQGKLLCKSHYSRILNTRFMYFLMACLSFKPDMFDVGVFCRCGTIYIHGLMDGVLVMPGTTKSYSTPVTLVPEWPFLKSAPYFSFCVFLLLFLYIVSWILLSVFASLFSLSLSLLVPSFVVVCPPLPPPVVQYQRLFSL